MARIELNSGEVKSRDPSELSEGELQSAVNCLYRPGDQGIWNQNGPTVFGDTDTGERVAGVALAKFDTGGSDLILAYSGTTLYGAAPGTSAEVLSSLITGLDPLAMSMSTAHWLDLWYFCNGYDRNYAIQEDGTVRFMGMFSPDERPAVVLVDGSAGASSTRASATPVVNSGFDDFANSVDSDADTFAKATFNSEGSATATWQWTGSDTGTLFLKFKWRVAGIWPEGAGPDTGPGGAGIGIGGTEDAGFYVKVTLEFSEDGGDTFSPLFEERRTAANPQTMESVVPITVNTNVTQVRATFDYTGGSNQATFAAYDVKIDKGSTSATSIPSSGFYYAWAETNALEGTPSSIGPEAFATSLSAINQASVPIPSAARNPATTDFLLYRSRDGGAFPEEMGLTATVPVSQAGGTYIDTFEKWLQSENPKPVFPMITVKVEDGTKRIARDTPPPSASVMTVFKGRMVFLTRDNPRALYGALTGRPESVPEISVITSFPFKEHDELVSFEATDDVLVLGAKELMIVLNEFPDTISGVFNAARAVPLHGAPGCVGQNAMTVYSVEGEQRVAWVSPFGIHVTNGTGHDKISDDMDWPNDVDTSNSANFALKYDLKGQRIIFNDGTTEFLLHVGREHRKSSGMPKITRSLRSRTDYAAGLVGGVHRVYGAHGSDGRVYLEESGPGLSAQITTARPYSDSEMTFIPKGRLRHSDFGARSATVTVRTHRDESDTIQEKIRTVALNGQRKTNFHVGLSGEGLEFSIVGPAGVTGRFQYIEIDPEDMGDSGRSSR